jgi:N-acetylmuramoyl-L-alanine amidase
MLEGAIRDTINGGGALPIRRCLVLHYTEGATAKSSISSMRSQGLAAHLVIDRDGTIYQCRPFNRTAAHAGVSRWVDPNTGRLYRGLNSHAIGIELANAGKNRKVIEWAIKNAGAKTIKLRHRNGGPETLWEVYPEAQLESVFEASKAIVEAYNLDDLTSHDHISPERKTDVGPAFPLMEIRQFCGFGKTLPVVYWTKE